MIKRSCDTGIVPGQYEDERSRSAGRWILVVTILGSSLSFIDSTAVGIALPVIQHSFHSTVTDAQWVIEVYSLMVASLLLVGGSAGDHFGRRRVYITGVALFAAGSAWCGLSATIYELIAGRAVQGFGAALLVPGGMAIISASFSEKRRGHAIGTWSAFTAITAAIGPVLGGWVVQHIAWNWIFFINIPLSLVVIGLALVRIPESRGNNVPLDWPGALMASLGLAGIVFGLIESSRTGWGDFRIIAALTGGIVCLSAFILIELRSKAPMLPLGLFYSRRFGGANLQVFILHGAINSSLIFFPFNLIQVQGYSPTATGAAFLPIIVIMFLLSRWAGGLVRRYGPKKPLVTGPIIAAAGFALFTFPGVGSGYWTSYFPGFVVLALGMAVTIAPLTTTVMSALPHDKVGIASGVNNAVSRLSALLAIAVYGIILVHVFSADLDRRLAPLDIPPVVKQQIDRHKLKMAGLEVPSNMPVNLVLPFKTAVGQSFIAGFRSIMIVSCILSVLSALCAWLLIE